MSDAQEAAPSPLPPSTGTALAGDDKLWIVLAHLSVLFGVGLVLPLIIYLVKRGDSPAVAYHSREALNFHITVLLYSIVCGLLIFVIIGIPLLALLGLATFVLAIVAAVKGADNVPYRYPLTLRLVS